MFNVISERKACKTCPCILTGLYLAARITVFKYTTLPKYPILELEQLK